MGERNVHPAVYLLGILAALILTFILVIVVMRPPLEDLVQLAGLLALTSLGSAVIGYLSYRLGWWRRLRSLHFSLTLGYTLAAVLTLINVWVTARLMFIEPHDLALGSVLLVFAGIISVSFGYFLSSAVTRALRQVAEGAEHLSGGDFSARVPEEGRDEISLLARSFNEMAEQLEQAQRAERALEAARRNLVAWASHDLRTPLASLRAMLEALSDGVVTDPETVSRYLKQSRIELGRMETLIDDLFELARLDAGHAELYCEMNSLSDLVSDTLEGFNPRARAKGVRLTGAVSPQVDPVWMAPDKISRVLHNLLDNAIRHTPVGGQVELDVTAENGAEKGNVVVTVKDTGDGIHPSDHPYVFDRFFRGERSRSRKGYHRGGAGLGLAIAKGLVEAHGGRIWAESEPGGGTVMRFTLPRRPRPGALDAPGSAAVYGGGGEEGER